MKYAYSIFMILGLFNTVKSITVEEFDKTILLVQGDNISSILDTYDWLVSNYGLTAPFTKEDIAEIIPLLTRNYFYDISIKTHNYLYFVLEHCALKGGDDEDDCVLDTIIEVNNQKERALSVISDDKIKKNECIKELIALLAAFRILQKSFNFK